MALTGYNVKGYCYGTTVEALNAFNGYYPLQIPTKAGMDFLQISSINAAGLVIYSVRNASNAVVITNARAQLSPCDPVILNQQFDLAQASGFWSFGFVTVLMFWILGQKLGLVLNFVKRA